MQPALQDINVMQGDSRDFFFRVRDRVWDAGIQDWIAGDYTDLSNWTGKSQIRKPQAATAGGIPELVGDWAVFITNQTTTKGGVLLRLTAAQTTSFPAAAATLAQALATTPNLVWDVQLNGPTGDVSTFISGGIRVLPEVTRL